MAKICDHVVGRAKNACESQVKTRETVDYNAPPHTTFSADRQALMCSVASCWNSVLPFPRLKHVRKCSDTQKNVRHRPAPGDSGRLPNLFPTSPPPAPEQILKRLNEYRQRQQRSAFFWREGDVDTPTKCLYRLYEYVMMDHNIGMRNILEYWWFHPDWKLEQIPDSKDKNPSRYAALAAVTGLLVESFERRYQLGLPRNGKGMFSSDEIERLRNTTQIPEKGPKWAAEAPPLRTTLKIPTYDDIILESFEDDRVSEAFKKKAMILFEPHIHFI